MRKAGITKADFLNGPQLGETVIVAVHPSRDPAKTLGFILHITYPDGHILKFYEDPNGAN
jgi:hypothetical protein